MKTPMRQRRRRAPLSPPVETRVYRGDAFCQRRVALPEDARRRRYASFDGKQRDAMPPRQHPPTGPATRHITRLTLLLPSPPRRPILAEWPQAVFRYQLCFYFIRAYHEPHLQRRQRRREFQLKRRHCRCAIMTRYAADARRAAITPGAAQLRAAERRLFFCRRRPPISFSPAMRDAARRRRWQQPHACATRCRREALCQRTPRDAARRFAAMLRSPLSCFRHERRHFAAARC